MRRPWPTGGLLREIKKIQTDKIISLDYDIFINYMKYADGRRTGLVTFCVETAFYNGLLKERYKGG